MENGRVRYDFCEKCGGLMKEGVCLNCGNRKVPALRTAAENADVTADNLEAAKMQRDCLADLQTPRTGNYKKILTAVGFFAVIMLVLLIVAFRLISADFQSAAGSRSLEARSSAHADDAGYVPTREDEFYPFLMDAMRDDLSYEIVWEEYETENKEKTKVLRAVYPQVKGDVPNCTGINDAIREAALYYISDYENIDMKDDSARDSYLYATESNVTYMDEALLSIAFRSELQFDGFYMPVISDINFDMRNGTVLTHDQIVEYSEQLGERVIEQDAVQNGGSLEMEGYSGSEVCERLREHGGTVFFTPVGLEVGLNYYSKEGRYYGWVTVTLKDFEKYLKDQIPYE